MLIKQTKSMIILKKSLCIFVALSFILSGISVYADSLAPASRLTFEQFKDRYLARRTLLAHKAVNNYIESQIPKDGIMALQHRYDTVDVKVGSNVIKETIMVCAVPGMLKNTISPGSPGQIAHVGLGRQNNMPVIYVDEKYFNNEDAIQHDKDEIAQWEAKRIALGLSYAQMREWIEKNHEAKQFAAEFHGNSASVDHLYDRIKADHENLLDLRNIYEAYLVYGLDEDDKDVNIAASPADDRAAILGDLLDLSRHPDDDNYRKMVTARGLSGYDPKLAADTIYEYMRMISIVLDQRQRSWDGFGADCDTISVSEEGGDGEDEERELMEMIMPEPTMRVTSMTITMPPNHDHIGLSPEAKSRIDDLFHELKKLSGSIETKEDMDNFWEVCKKQEIALTKLLLDIGGAVPGEFIISLERRMQLGDTMRWRPDENLLYRFEMAELIEEDMDRWVNAAYGVANNPRAGFGTFAMYSILNYALWRDTERAALNGMSTDELIGLLLNERSEHRIIRILHVIRKRVSDRCSASGTELAGLGLRDGSAENLVSALEDILDRSGDPYILRIALQTYYIIKEVPEEKRNARLSELIQKAISGIEPLQFRCWLANNVVPNPSASRLTYGLCEALGDALRSLSLQSPQEIVVRLEADPPSVSVSSGFSSLERFTIRENDWSIINMVLKLARPDRIQRQPSDGPAREDEKRKGSPADCLTVISSVEGLLRRAVTTGFTFAELQDIRNMFKRSTVAQEFKIMKDLKIFVPVSAGSTRCRLSDIFIKRDVNGEYDLEFTRKLIVEALELKYKVGELGDPRPLHRGNIDPGERPGVGNALKKFLLELRSKMGYPYDDSSDVAESPEKLAELYKEGGYLHALGALRITPRRYYDIARELQNPEQYLALDYDEACGLVGKKMPFGVLSSRTTIKNIVLAALDKKINGFKAARESGNIRGMAELYREKVINHQSGVEAADGKRERGQQAFFSESGLGGLLVNPNPNLRDLGSFSEILNIAIPGIVDDHNEYALHVEELEQAPARDSQKPKAEGEIDIIGSNDPIELLDIIRSNRRFLRKALDGGIGISEPKGAAILCSLGILVPADDLNKVYRFSNTMRGQDENYTVTLINGAMESLKRRDAPWGNVDLLREHVKIGILHEINVMVGMMAKPALPKDKVVWRIIEQSVVAPSQRSKFAQDLKNYYSSPDCKDKERIWILRAGESIAQAMARIREITPEAEFDVALSAKSHIDKVPAEISKILVFRGDNGADVVQIEGVIAALRALRIENRQEAINILLRIYSALNGSRYKGDIPPPSALSDPRQFARDFVFDLPATKPIPHDDMLKMNARLFALLTAA